MKYLFIILYTLLISSSGFAQSAPEPFDNIFQRDDTVQFGKLLSKENINQCFGNYSLLSHAVRYNAKRCISKLVKNGADVNKTCNGYIPPLMHAVKYSSLDVLEFLVKHGAKVDYLYIGDNGALSGHTPFTYAEKLGRQEIADYLRSILKE